MNRTLMGVFVSLWVGYSSAFAGGADWHITQPAWTDNHEKLYGDFITRLGTAVENRQCNKVRDCLKSTANMYYGSDPAGLTYHSDCADLPYLLRSYFAFKNGLPFSFESQVTPRPAPDGRSTPDIRYTPVGNVVTKRTDVTVRKVFFRKKYPDALQLLNADVINLTSSASFRMMGSDDSIFTDFYPTRLDRNSIHSGTMIYDPNGHVAVIYKVTDDGRLYYIDAHPDGSLTRGMFTPKFVRSNPYQGAGFKNFRPLQLVGANFDGTDYVGGSVQGTPDSALSTYGLEQFYGTNPVAGSWSKGQFLKNNQSYDYYDYVRMSLTLGAQHMNPMDDMTNLVNDICVSLKDRVGAVDSARTSGVQDKAHPERLPLNIYGSDGEWENFATSSRDARLKVSYMDLLNQTKEDIAKYKAHDPSIAYSGGNLAKDLYDAYAAAAKACQFQYTTSNGLTVLMNLEAARQRLFAMSFDPYTCVELRWGARLPQELQACKDSGVKKQWYTQEQWLRNQTERTYDARMDYSLGELNGPKPGAGIATAPDVDIVGFLKSQM